MRIQRLDLEAFGPFAGATIDLSAPGPAFHVIGGRNEAGKSTTRRALVDLLFGIPEKTLDAHREIAAQTRAEHRLAENDRVRGLLAAREGNVEEALAFLGEAVEKLEACGSSIEWIRALGDRARLLQEAGRQAEADADLERARELRNACDLDR